MLTLKKYRSYKNEPILKNSNFYIDNAVFVAITYAAMELRGWFPKGSSTYLLMRETHYNAGILFGC